MPGGNGTGPLQGGRRGQGRGGKGGPRSGGAGGSCVCPKCGHTVPHEAGQPCSRKTCPQCGTTMIRK